MANQITFQAVVEIENKASFSEFFVLPRIFKNKLSPRTSQTVRLVDSNGRVYNVRAIKFNDSRIMLMGVGWKEFVGASIQPDTEKLCFRLRRNGSFDVVTFDSVGEETLADGNGDLHTNRCLIEVSDETIVEEYTPLFFLHDLDVQYRLHTDKTATVFGPHQIADVEVIYEEEDVPDSDDNDSDDDVKSEEEVVQRSVWRAVGFTGPKWTNMCYEHEVSMGGHIMLTNLGQGTYLFDYFNEAGLGLDAAHIVSRTGPPTVRETLSEEYVTESEGEEMDSLRHSCKIAGHQHNNEHPCFFKKLTDHSFRTNSLTIPGHFVRQHQVNKYTNACVYVGSLKFKAKLDIIYDARKDGDESHVVLITDWLKVSRKTGYVAGKELRFELNVVVDIDGPSVEFHVC